MKKWITGSLLSFQQNLNTNFKSSETIYSCGGQMVTRTWHNESRLLPFEDKLFQCLDLSNIKRKARTELEPHRIKNETCFLLLVSNLAEPDWVSVSCRKRILHWIICEKTSKMKTIFNRE